MEGTINPAKLFVGNLPWSVNGEQLRDLFAQYGNIVDAVVIVDKFNGRSKGIGFVEFEEADNAQAAIEALNEYEIEGRKIMVNVAQPKAERPPRQGGYGGGRGGNGGYGGGRGGYGNNRGHGGGDRRGGYDNRRSY